MSNPGCGFVRYFSGGDHACECWSYTCTGFDHVCRCGQYWSSSVRTRFLSFDHRGYQAGDPCCTRMKIMRDRGRKMWRVFELAQVGQTVSRHGDIWVPQWVTARDIAAGWIAADRRRMEEYLYARMEAML